MVSRPAPRGQSPFVRKSQAPRLPAAWTIIALVALLAPGAVGAAEPPSNAVPPAATAAEDAPETGVVQRAHHAYAERPSVSAFNPRLARVQWDESWPKFRLAEYVATGAAGALVFAARAIPPQENNWRDMGDFDATARRAVRLPTIGARNTADDASDFILTMMVNQLVIDATLVAWWGHDRPSVGSQLLLIDLEALAVTGSLQALVSSLVSRWRPFRDTCVGPLEKQTRDCRESKQFTSFWSGHTSGAFTAAGLMCMHHMHIPLYGGGAGEALTCGASFAAAATVGYLRMAADMHFMTDVLVGAAIGTMSGLGIPWLLHYRGGRKLATSQSDRGDQVSVRLIPTPMGLALSGEL